MSWHYILDGTEPVACEDVRTWAIWMAEHVSCYVAETWVTPDVRVSTVFLGLNLQDDEGPPMVFETMVFVHGLPTMQQRYSTWQDAEQGHQAIVEGVSADERL